MADDSPIFLPTTVPSMVIPANVSAATPISAPAPVNAVGNISILGASGTMRDPAVAYEHAVFGLTNFQVSVTEFYETVKPQNWNKFSIFDVKVKENRHSKLEKELENWKQHVIMSCSVIQNAQHVLNTHLVVIKQCEATLDKCQMLILSARDMCDQAKADAAKVADADFKLEKIKPPTFSGKFSEWQSYSDLFRAAVIDNSKISGGLKLVYLKNSLVGDAAQIAASFPPTNLSFAEAWALVEKRYNKKREIVFSHLQILFSMPNVSDTASGIRKVVDTVNQCTRSLKLLNVDVDKWDVFLVYWVHLKLDPETKKQWLLQESDDLPVLSAFLDFLETRATALMATPQGKSKAGGFKSGPTTLAHHLTTAGKKLSCFMCSDNHGIYHCSQFLAMTVPERQSFVKDKKLCNNCLGQHQVKECKSTRKCQTCDRTGHNTLLHRGSKANQRPGNSYSQQTQNTQNSNSDASGSTQAANANLQIGQNSRLHPHAFSVPLSTSHHSDTNQVSNNHASSSDYEQSVVLMATLQVQVSDAFGNLHACRVFLDPGSEANFVSEHFVNKLSLRRIKSCVKVTGIGGAQAETSRGLVNFTALSKNSAFSLPVTALILPKLTGNLPKQKCNVNYPHLMGLDLSDPNMCSPAPVVILLGADAAAQILVPGLRTGPPGTPIAQNTKFGWYLMGQAHSSSPHQSDTTPCFSVRVWHSACAPSDPCLESSLQKFWELDEPSTSSNALCSEDSLCESYFQSTVSRDSDGRFQVSLPIATDAGDLGDSRNKAISSFKSLERQFDKDKNLKDAYFSQIEKYLQNKWIEKVSPVESFKQLSLTTTTGNKISLVPYYIPHHVVVKPENTTTQYRIVFNASAKTTSGKSLNCILLSGPKIQTDLHPLLTRFRFHPIALCADIVKFYHQVKVISPDNDLQRFVWRVSPNDAFTDFRFLRITFGVTSAPYLAIRVLRQLGEQFMDTHPLAYKCIQNDFLVDNLLANADSPKEALEVISQINYVLKQGHFPLQKWVSNHPKVLSAIPASERDSFSFSIHEDDAVKTLGLFWHPASDTFRVKICIPSLDCAATKRQVLSHTARIFDPLQWLAPVTVFPKILLQQIWKEKVGWDDPIPTPLFKKWKKYCEELELLSQFRISRCLTFPLTHNFEHSSRKDYASYELAGFCDASNVAYAACVYLVTTQNSQTKTELIAARTKVAPVGGETTPRLELCSMVLLTTLVNFVSTALVIPCTIHFSKVKCYTDSTACLGQLFSSEKQPVFVANRIRKIRNSPVSINWYHVPGDQNPADCASRGISSANFLSHPLWLNGPPFLITGEIPQQPYEQSQVSHVVSVDNGLKFVNNQITQLIKTTSSYVKMQRLVAYWIRYINCLKLKHMNDSSPITPLELNKALIPIVKCIQSESFSSELLLCKAENVLKGNLRSLSPFVDSQGVLRVGGRLSQSELQFGQCHPILLPKFYHRPTQTQELSNHFLLALARHFHEINLHAGPKLLHSQILSEFWILRGKDLCNKVYRQCIKCFKTRPQPMTQIMGQLPSARVVSGFHFMKVGLDYAGPLEIALTPGRKPKLIKAYVCVFVCMVTKAVHLEYVGGLSTPDFIAALQRFCSIRNSPSDIFCDGGRNFLGAKNEIEALQSLLTDPQHQRKIALFCAGEKVQYHFSPPHGPHHGGLWEAAVKSMKQHLARVTQGHHLSLEEFITLLARISAALNSRPLTPLSNNPDDFQVLTPFHFLSLRAPRYFTEEDAIITKGHRSRWHLVQQMFQHLSRRWTQDYLHTLQQRGKWLESTPNISKGTLVLLHDHDPDATLGPTTYQLGRIEEVFPGKDGKVRACDLRIPIPESKDDKSKDGRQVREKKKFKTLRRPITRLSPLPLDDDVTSAYVTFENTSNLNN